MAGGLVYVGHDTGLEVLDPAAGPTPQPIGHAYLPGPVLKLRVAGGKIYAACGEWGLQIVDASDPTDLKVLGSLQTGYVRDAVATGNLLLLAEAGLPPDSAYGLRMVDVSDPLHPASIGLLPLANGALDVAVTGSYALVGFGTDPAGAHGMVVVDIANPALPVLVGALQTDRPVNDILNSGSLAYLAAGFPLSGRVLVVDMADPTQPALQVGYALPDAAYALAQNGADLHIAAGILGLMTLDSANPFSLARTGRVSFGQTATALAASGGDIALAQRGNDLPGSVVVTTPGFPGGAVTPYSEAADATAADGSAYLLSRDGLTVYDTTNPASPVELGRWRPQDADLTSLDVRGTLAAICEGRTVHLLDLTDPAAPSLLGDARIDCGVAVRPVLAGDTLFVVNGTGYEAFDVSNPAAPSLLGAFATTGYTSDLSVDGATGYLPAGRDLLILDVSSPGNPVLLGTYSAPSDLYAVKAQGGLAFVSGLETYLSVLDVSVPSSPDLLAEVSGGDGFDIVLSDVHVLVAAGVDGVVAFNVADPAVPYLEGFFDTSGVATDAAVDGSTVFLAAGKSRHWVLNGEMLGASCEIISSITPGNGVTVCYGTEVLLDAGVYQATGCQDSVTFQWYEDGAPIPGGTRATYTVPDTHPTGVFTFRVEVICESNPSCLDASETWVEIVQDSWPVVRYNSLRLTKVPSDFVISWEIDSGAGEFNVHQTLVKDDVPGLFASPSTVVATTDQFSVTRSFSPPTGQVAYEQVYGRSECTGASVP